MKPKNLSLVIGDKNLSSWSMRPWLALKASGLKFKEINIKLDQKDTSAKIKKYSPSGRVPALRHDSLTVWDSLAICEYLAELAPHLYPWDAKQRAVARSYVAEMHSSFQGLRTQMSMDIKLRMKMTHLNDQTVNDIKRILDLWTEALVQNKGPYLFGKEFGIVDAFYAPVVMRFLTYGVKPKNKLCQKYIKTIQNNKFVKEWVKGAKRERGSNSVF